MLEEIRIKQNLKKLTEKLEYLYDNILLKNNDPIVKIREMSVFVLKIEESGEFCQLKFLCHGLEYLSFERRIIDPIKEYFEKFGHDVVTIGNLANGLLNAEEIIILAKSDLTKIISEIKTNSYLF